MKVKKCEGVYLDFLLKKKYTRLMFSLKKRSLIDYSIITFCLVGIGFMSYLLRLHFLKGGNSICDFSSHFSCQIVNQSLYSEVLGIPVALFGLIYFFVVGVMVAGQFSKHTFRAIILFTLGSLVFSLYLSGIEYFYLGVVCLFCELSKIVMVSILLLSFVVHRRQGNRLQLFEVVASGVLGMSLVGASYFLQK